MLTENLVKEEFSLAYIFAVAAAESFTTNFRRVDNDSVDATVHCNGQLSEDSTLFSPEINLQLKASSNLKISNNNIHFPLPIKNYNDLRLRTANPRLLVVLCLPSDRVDWLSHTPTELVLKRCAYFLNLRGMPEVNNAASVTVQLPITNVFSPAVLRELMLRTSREEEL